MSQEVRDKLAALEGWIVEDTDVQPGRGPSQVWRNGDGDWVPLEAHPIPDDPNTCAAMWDRHAGEKGWRRMCNADGDWYAFELKGERRYVTVGHSGHDAASELRDRWALLGEVLKARGVWA